MHDKIYPIIYCFNLLLVIFESTITIKVFESLIIYLTPPKNTFLKKIFMKCYFPNIFCAGFILYNVNTMTAA